MRLLRGVMVALLLAVAVLFSAPPRAMAHDVGDGGRCDPEVLAKRAVGGIPALVEDANGCDLHSGQLRGRTPLTEGGPVFLRTVAHVRILSTEEQVAGANAGRRVTAMQDAHAVWNRTNIQFVADAVGEQRISPLAFLANLGTDATIPVRVAVGSPQPTLRRLSHPPPESIGERHARRADSAGRVAGRRTVLSGATRDGVRSRHERCATPATHARDAGPSRTALALFHAGEYSSVELQTLAPSVHQLWRA
jgi:hypothetical protein